MATSKTSSKGSKDKAAPKVIDKKQEAPEKADAVKIMVADQTFMADYKTFSTGSRGWHVGGKVIINGLRCQLNCLATVIGSKPESSK
jgi:hypothetical protein